MTTFPIEHYLYPVKHLFSILFILAFVTLNAQVITAKEMMEKLYCTNDTTCINSFIVSKGFIVKPKPYGHMSNMFEYKSINPVCKQEKDSMAYNYLSLFMYGLNNLLELSTFCKDIYTKLLQEYKALGFVVYKQIGNEYRYRSNAYSKYRLVTEIHKRKNGVLLYTIEIKSLADKQ